jgi:uncharacterized protein YyaL (SSP411 family)
MKKIIVFLISAMFLFAFDWSGKVHWVKNFQTAQQIAKKEHKLIMVDLSLSDCPPCQYIAVVLYSNPKIASYINKNFVPLFYLTDKDRVPFAVSQYFTGVTPTLLFITPDDKLYYRVIGARPPKVFVNTLNTIANDFKNNKKVTGVAKEPKTVHY